MYFIYEIPEVSKIASGYWEAWRKVNSNEISCQDLSVESWQSRQAKPLSENVHLGTKCHKVFEQHQGCTWDSDLLDCIKNQSRAKPLRFWIFLHFLPELSTSVSTLQAGMDKDRVKMPSVWQVGVSIPLLRGSSKDPMPWSCHGAGTPSRRQKERWAGLLYKNSKWKSSGKESWDLISYYPRFWTP